MATINKVEKPDGGADDLLAKLRAGRLHDVASDARRTLKKAGQTKQDVQDGIKVLGVIGHAFAMAARGARYVAGHIPGPATAFGHGYKKYIWDPVTHGKDADGDPKFFKGRAAGLIATTALAAASLWPFEAPFGERGPLADLALYEATHKTEHVYLYTPEEIQSNHTGHVFTVDGSYSLPVNTSDVFHDEIKDSIFNDAWSVIHHGRTFKPDFVKASVPNVVNDCTEVRYGFRAKIFSRFGNVYPQLLDVTCRPLGTGSDNEPGPTKTFNAPHETTPATVQQQNVPAQDVPQQPVHQIPAVQ